MSNRNRPRGLILEVIYRGTCFLSVNLSMIAVIHVKKKVFFVGYIQKKRRGILGERNNEQAYF